MKSKTTEDKGDDTVIKKHDLKDAMKDLDAIIKKQALKAAELSERVEKLIQNDKDSNIKLQRAKIRGQSIAGKLTIKVNDRVNVEKFINDSGEIVFSVANPTYQQGVYLKPQTAAIVVDALKELLKETTIDEELERKMESNIIFLTEYLRSGKIVKL